MVWQKNTKRYKIKSEEKCRELFKEIDALNKQEDSSYGNNDLDEHDTSTCITKEAIRSKVSELNETIRTAGTQRNRRKAMTLKKKLKEADSKVEKYNNQLYKSGKPSGYNQTDPDAGTMMVKNKVEMLMPNNIMAGSEKQFITGVSAHQTNNDRVCFNDYLEAIQLQRLFRP